MIVLYLGIGLHSLVLVMESGYYAPLFGKGFVSVKPQKTVVLKLELVQRAYFGRHAYRSSTAYVVTKTNLIVQVAEYIDAEALYCAQREYKG